ncbi:uncharacterized protein C2845_PM05G35140 [Panicum miliaceum]|uniref:Uncharacterized protein n=1 Tax=Panicum miliaceum TaxID=4540 RepID=A0A3L6T0M8_PANMI|nr:uncharacterized protein C2845_PM05G35140 [Panicum miliaceum]
MALGLHEASVLLEEAFNDTVGPQVVDKTSAGPSSPVLDHFGGKQALSRSIGLPAGRSKSKKLPRRLVQQKDGKLSPPSQTLPKQSLDQSQQTKPSTAPRRLLLSDMPLRRILGLSAAVTGRLRHGFSSSASRPTWAMIYHTTLVDSPAPRASLQLAAPPCASEILVPAHLGDPPAPPRPRQ